LERKRRFSIDIRLFRAPDPIRTLVLGGYFFDSHCTYTQRKWNYGGPWPFRLQPVDRPLAILAAGQASASVQMHGSLYEPQRTAFITGRLACGPANSDYATPTLHLLQPTGSV